MDGIADAFVGIVSAFVELMVRLLAWVFSSTWLALHVKGMERVFYAISALAAFHLLMALVLAVVGSFDGLILSILFNGWVLLGSFVVLLVSFAASIAVDVAAAAKEQRPAGRSLVSSLVCYGLAVAIVFGGLSIGTAQTERRSAKERLCAAGAARLSQEVKDNSNKAFDLAEKLLKRDIRGRLPCQPESGT